jgi:hypothetical protein
MHLRAVSIGSTIPRLSFDAAVHSTFQSVANLRLLNDCPLITLLAASDFDLPQGIRLDSPKEFSFKALSLGEKAFCRAGVLRFEAFPTTIDLRPARLWVSDLPSVHADMNCTEAALAWNTVWQALNRWQTASGAEIVAEELISGTSSNLIGRRASILVREIIAATRQYDAPLAAESCNKLIGLGTGLTPSGDDLIVGYLAGLWSAVRDRKEHSNFLNALEKTLRSAAGQTNEISQAYLVQAASGQVSSGLTRLIEAIAYGWESDRLLEAAIRVMRIGHSSGMDTVTGLLVGLDLWKTQYQ